MQGAVDLLESERGIFCIALLLAATVLTVVGKVSGDDWMTFAKWLLVTLVTSKTVTTAVDSLKNKSTPPPTPSA